MLFLTNMFWNNSTRMKRKWKIFTGTIVLLPLIFILPGLVTPKIKIKTNTRIKQSLTKVFVILGNPVRLSEWMDGLEKIEHIYGLPFSEGSKYRFTYTVGNSKLSAVEEIVKVDWKKRLVIDVKMSKCDIYMDMYFFQMDNYSEILVTYTLSGNDPVARLMLPWMKPMIKKKLKKGMNRFSEMMEKTNL